MPCISTNVKNISIRTHSQQVMDFPFKTAQQAPKHVGEIQQIIYIIICICAFGWHVKYIIYVRKTNAKESFTSNYKLERAIKKHGCLVEIHSGGENPHWNVVLSKKKKKEDEEQQKYIEMCKGKYSKFLTFMEIFRYFSNHSNTDCEALMFCLNG